MMMMMMIVFGIRMAVSQRGSACQYDDRCVLNILNTVIFTCQSLKNHQRMWSPIISGLTPWTPRAVIITSGHVCFHL